MMIIDTTTTFHSTPTWKLYENPFYTSPQNHNSQDIQQQNQQEEKRIHRLHLPVSTRKIAASFWDLTFIKPFMDSELDAARAQIMELKAQLQYERKARKEAESVSKQLRKELLIERKGREALEKACGELAMEITSSKAEMSRLKTDMEEERKMLCVAEGLREERVQMKLSDAKLMLEQKLSELEITHNINDHQDKEEEEEEEEEKCKKKGGGNRKVVSLEAENPHIKRGIRGFVEFPKVVRAIGSRSRHFGTKLECQKAQLMILLKHKTHIHSNNPIIT